MRGDGRPLADAFDVNLLSLPELPAVFALGDGAALLLDLKERAVVVLAAGGAVSLNARLAIRDGLVR
jgi:hypothetical protein